jgi:hypothetical protein
VRRSCSHLLVHSFISICRVLSFRLDFNVMPHNTIQCNPSSSILGGKVLLYSFQSSRPVLVIDHWLICCLLENNFMSLLVTIAADQNQVDCIGNWLSLESLHVFQIVNTKLQVGNRPDGDRETIVAQSYSRSCCHRPSRICDSFGGCIYIVNAIQVGNLIQRINATGACQIGRRDELKTNSYNIGLIILTDIISR